MYSDNFCLPCTKIMDFKARETWFHHFLAAGYLWNLVNLQNFISLMAKWGEEFAELLEALNELTKCEDVWHLAWHKIDTQ